MASLIPRPSHVFNVTHVTSHVFNVTCVTLKTWDGLGMRLAMAPHAHHTRTHTHTPTPTQAHIRTHTTYNVIRIIIVSVAKVTQSLWEVG